MEKYVTDLRIKHWMALIDESSKSGMSRTQWLEKNNISRTTFYYWFRRVRRYLAEQSGLVEPDR